MLAGLLIEAPRGLAVAAMGYALFDRRRGEVPSEGSPFSGEETARASAS